MGYWSECGHGAFSPSRTLNDTVGFILHTILFVPYFAWQFTHGKHHKNTNAIMTGETWVPPTETEYLSDVRTSLLPAKVQSIWRTVERLVYGWQVYLITNASGGKLNWMGDKKASLFVDHFMPYQSE